MAMTEAATVTVFWHWDGGDVERWEYTAEYNDGEVKSGPLDCTKDDDLDAAIASAIKLHNLDVTPDSFVQEDEVFASWMRPGVELFPLFDEEEGD